MLDRCIEAPSAAPKPSWGGTWRLRVPRGVDAPLLPPLLPPRCRGGALAPLLYIEHMSRRRRGASSSWRR